ncbi:MAG: hypothetical protein LBF64_03790 [Oscillospiraceae bacterium]|jgi:acyl-CoA thioesterase FadM|nr:hypothetical protein [Oscillospiraceae bacterium]
MTIQPYVRRTQFYETDQMGIIHHANYIRWFEEARVTDRTTGALRVTGESRHCFVRSEGLRPVSLQKAVPALYEAFAAQTRLPAG